MSRPVTFSRLLRHPIANSESLESSALLIGAAVFIVSGCVAALVFWDTNVPIAGPGSIGQFVAIGGGIAAVVVFTAARVLVSASTTPGRDALGAPGVRLHWFDVAALALAHGVIVLLGSIAIADVVEKSFSGALVFTFAAAVLAGVAIALAAYAVLLWAVSLTPIGLSYVLAAFLVVGTFASMLSASDPLWWKENLSTLGISDDFSARAFNITLVIAGVIVTTIAHVATATIPTSTPKEVRGRNLVRTALTVIGILLSCVGLFPLDERFGLHNVAASGMAAVFVAMVIGLRWLVPAIPRVFILLGYVFVGVIVVLAVFFVTGYYNLTAVELVAFLLIFSWLIVFLRNTSAMRAPALTGAQTLPEAQPLPGVAGRSIS